MRAQHTSPIQAPPVVSPTTQLRLFRLQLRLPLNIVVPQYPLLDMNPFKNKNIRIKFYLFCRTHVFEHHRYIVEFYITKLSIQCSLPMCRLTQRPYLEHILNRFRLDHITPRNTPLPIEITIDNSMSPKTDSEKKTMDDKPYRSLLGSVMRS